MILSCQDLAVNDLRIMITVSLPFLRLQKLFPLIGDLILSSDGRRFLQKEKTISRVTSWHLKLCMSIQNSFAILDKSKRCFLLHYKQA